MRIPEKMTCLREQEHKGVMIVCNDEGSLQLILRTQAAFFARKMKVNINKPYNKPTERIGGQTYHRYN